MSRLTLAGAIAFALAVPSATAALDLPAALSEVAAANPSLAARRDMTAAAHARIAPAGAWSPPMFEAGLVNVPVTGELDMDPMTMRMVGIAQKLPLSGANGLARRAATEAWHAEAAMAEREHWMRLGEAWAAYADAWFAADLARCADDHRQAMDALVASARARYASGRARYDDVLAAEAERARSFADLATWRGEERGARARLDALRGRAPGGAPEPLAPPPDPPDGDDGWRLGVNGEHPWLRAASASERRWTLAARAARRMAWPDLELRGSYGVRDAVDHTGLPADNMFSVTAAVMLPLFARSRERAEGREMDAMARAATAERRAAELDLRARIEQALAERAAARSSVSLLADTVLVAQRAAYESAQRAYASGLADLSRVLDAEHALYAQETALVRARQQAARSTAMLVSLAARADLVGLSLPPAPKGQP
jgi:outer membrane protein TolC